MSDKTLISWSDATWNPVSGCTEVSPGCAHCYAKTFAERFRGLEGHYYENGFDVQLRPTQLEKPLHWMRPRRIFVNSMSDLFHEDVPDDYIDRVFAVMALTPQHTYQLLTKRIERALEYLSKGPQKRYFNDLLGEWRSVEECPRVDAIGQAIYDMTGRLASGDPADDEQVLLDDLPLPNVLIGPTIENQHFADVRLPILAQIKEQGWRTMVSYEPALGPVDFGRWLGKMPEFGAQWRPCVCAEIDPTDRPCLTCIHRENAIDWLICGGESGTGRRPFDHDWARDAMWAARVRGVPFFMKQDGAQRPEVYETLPDALKVREFPR